MNDYPNFLKNLKKKMSLKNFLEQKQLKTLQIINDFI